VGVRAAAVIVALTLATFAGCDDHKFAPPPRQEPPLPASAALPTGESVMNLPEDDQFLTPSGFRPQLRFRVPSAGWSSTYRGSDGFDIAQPALGVDVPLVVVAFLTPAEADPTTALRAVARRARAAGAVVNFTEFNDGALSLSVKGGRGALVASRDRGIVLDAAPEGYVDIEAREYVGAPPLLIVTRVPDFADIGPAHDRASGFITGVRVADDSTPAQPKSR
jgi:hypothetical protein